MPLPKDTVFVSRIAKGFVAAMLNRRAQVLAEQVRQKQVADVERKRQQDADDLERQIFLRQFEDLPQAIEPEPFIMNRGGSLPRRESRPGRRR